MANKAKMNEEKDIELGEDDEDKEAQRRTSCLES